MAARARHQAALRFAQIGLLRGRPGAGRLHHSVGPIHRPVRVGRGVHHRVHHQVYAYARLSLFRRPGLLGQNRAGGQHQARQQPHSHQPLHLPDHRFLLPHQV